jgi:hypothetical protein
MLILLAWYNIKKMASNPSLSLNLPEVANFPFSSFEKLIEYGK